MTIIKEGGGERREHDFYETPLAFAATTLYNIVCDPISVKTALDPGAGTGIWGKALRYYNATAHITGVEMYPAGDQCAYVNEMSKVYDSLYLQDYLKWETDTKFDLIIGNPPYKLAHEFVNKSLDLLAPSGQLVFLMRLAMLESQKRYKMWWTRTPIYKVMVSTRRISFTNDGKSDDTAYAVFVWKEGWDARPLLDWLYWEYDNIPKPVAISSWNFSTPIIVPEWHYTQIEKEGKE